VTVAEEVVEIEAATEDTAPEMEAVTPEIDPEAPVKRLKSLIFALPLKIIKLSFFGSTKKFSTSQTQIILN
jgi:hypothetical protein